MPSPAERFVNEVQQSISDFFDAVPNFPDENNTSQADATATIAATNMMSPIPS